MLNSVLTCLRTSIAAVLLAVGVTATAHAAIKWDTERINVTGRAMDAALQTSVGFVNEGNLPVTITAVHAGCGCTVPTLPKLTYAPGERGELAISYRPGSREGANEVDISINTDSGNYNLKLIADVKALVTFDTRYVVWTAAEPLTPKQIHMRFADGYIGEIVDVSTPNPLFRASFSRVDQQGREYKINVEPTSAQDGFSAITVKIRLPDDPRERVFNLVARVIGKSPSPSPPSS
jgi:hypothetical protein